MVDYVYPHVAEITPHLEVVAIVFAQAAIHEHCAIVRSEKCTRGTDEVISDVIVQNVQLLEQ